MILSGKPQRPASNQLCLIPINDDVLDGYSVSTASTETFLFPDSSKMVVISFKSSSLTFRHSTLVDPTSWILMSDPFLRISLVAIYNKKLNWAQLTTATRAWLRGKSKKKSLKLIMKNLFFRHLKSTNYLLHLIIQQTKNKYLPSEGIIFYETHVINMQVKISFIVFATHEVRQKHRPRNSQSINKDLNIDKKNDIWMH